MHRKSLKCKSMQCKSVQCMEINHAMITHQDEQNISSWILHFNKQHSWSNFYIYSSPPLPSGPPLIPPDMCLKLQQFCQHKQLKITTDQLIRCFLFNIWILNISWERHRLRNFASKTASPMTEIENKENIELQNSGCIWIGKFGILTATTFHTNIWKNCPW